MKISTGTALRRSGSSAVRTLTSLGPSRVSCNSISGSRSSSIRNSTRLVSSSSCGVGAVVPSPYGFANRLGHQQRFVGSGRRTFVSLSTPLQFQVASKIGDDNDEKNAGSEDGTPKRRKTARGSPRQRGSTKKQSDEDDASTNAENVASSFAQSEEIIPPSLSSSSYHLGAAALKRLLSRVHPDIISASRLPGAEGAAKGNADSLAKLNSVLETIKSASATSTDSQVQLSQASRDQQVFKALRSLPTEVNLQFSLVVQPEENAPTDAKPTFKVIQSTFPLRAPAFLVARQIELEARRRESAASASKDDASPESRTATAHIQFASCSIEMSMYKLLPQAGFVLTEDMERRSQNLRVLIMGDFVQAEEDQSDREARVNHARAYREISWMTENPDPDGEMRAILERDFSSLMKDPTFLNHEEYSAHSKLGELHDTPDEITSMRRIKKVSTSSRLPSNITRHTVDAWLCPFDVEMVFAEPFVPQQVLLNARTSIEDHGREIHRRASANLPLTQSQGQSRLERVLEAEAEEIESGKALDWSGISIMLTASDEDLKRSGGEDTMTVANESRARLEKEGWVVLPASIFANVRVAQQADGTAGGKRRMDVALDEAARAVGQHITRAQAIRDERRICLRRCASLMEMLRKDILGCREISLGSEDPQLRDMHEAVDPFNAERLLAHLTLDPVIYERLLGASPYWRHMAVCIVGPSFDPKSKDVAFLPPHNSNVLCIVASDADPDNDQFTVSLKKVRKRLAYNQLPEFGQDMPHKLR